MPFFSNSSVLRNAEGERHGSSGNGNRSTRKIPPLEGRVASGVSRKPDDGRGDLRSAFASVETNCDPVRHLFRRQRRHLPLKGKDWVELVPFLRPSKRTARKIPPLEGRVASGVSRKPDDGRGDFRCASAPFGADCISVRHLFRRLRRHLPLKGKERHLPLKGKDWVELVLFLRPSKRTARKIPPLEGRVASGVSRKPDDGRDDFRCASAPFGADCISVRHLFRRLRRHLPLKGKDASASVETSCDPIRHLFRRLRRHLPLKGKDLGVELVPFLRPSERAARKIPPLEGRVASGVSRKPDDGRGDLRSPFASVEADCFSVRHLFRRLRRHLPLKGKDLGVELVPFLHPSKRAARKNPSPRVIEENAASA